MNKPLLSLCMVFASYAAPAFAEETADKWLGNWSSKGSTDLVKKIEIVRDKQDIKVKFTKSPDGDYLGEGIAEWFPGKNGGAFVANFAKEPARFLVVIKPHSKNSIQASFYTKYDDGQNRKDFSQSLTRKK